MKQQLQHISSFGLLLLAVIGIAPNAFAQTANIATSLTKVSAPAPLASSAISPSNILNLAFNMQDLAAISATSGMNTCFTYTEKHLATDATGRISSVRCIELRKAAYTNSLRTASIESSSYETIVKTAATSPQKKLSAELKAAAIQRLSNRIISNTASNYSFLKTIVEGKLDVNFSLSTFSGMLATTPETRPTYSLSSVVIPSPKSTGNVAAIGSLGFSGHILNASQPELNISRRIVETWEPNQSATQPTAAITSENPPKATTAAYVKRALGLGVEPLTKFHLHIERQAALGLSNIMIRIQEGAGLGFIDVSSLVSGNIKGISWELRLPYYANAFVISQDNMIVSRRIAYEYNFSSTFATRIGYNPNFINGEYAINASRYTANLVYLF